MTTNQCENIECVANPNFNPSYCDKINTWFKVKKRSKSSQFVDQWDVDNQLEIDISEFSTTKKNQIKRLKNIIQNNRAYSIYYYSKARVWKWNYWVTNITALLLTGAKTFIDVFFNQTDSESDCRSNTINSIGIVLGVVITTILAIITFLNASLRRRHYEEAGDEYKILAVDLYRNTFYSNESLQDKDVNEILNEYTIKMSAYSKIYEEPNASTIKDIMTNDDFDMNIILIDGKSRR
jgi:hypothetical protein